MRRSILAVGCAFIVAGAFAQVSSPTAILPSTVKWTPSPAVPGLESAWFVGVADKQGIYALRVKLPSGAKIPPHTHPDDRFSVVLSGTIHVGFGEIFDERTVVAIPTGGIYVAPAGVSHYVWAKDGDAIYQESGVGPTATNFIKQ